ncbi:hypothetical protein HGG75_21385 [Ochrobactrum pseudogrignonense]|nr:hypothetical protein [Brucella pseudogrignonensis]
MTKKPRLLEERVRDGLDTLPEPVDLPVDWLSCHDFPRPSLKSASGRAPESPALKPTTRIYERKDHHHD